jgi:hypothetical protein
MSSSAYRGTCLPVAILSLVLCSSSAAIAEWPQEGLSLGITADVNTAHTFDLGGGESWIIFQAENPAAVDPLVGDSVLSVGIRADGTSLGRVSLLATPDRFVTGVVSDRGVDGSVGIAWLEQRQGGGDAILRCARFHSPGILAWPDAITLDSDQSPELGAHLDAPISVAVTAGGSLVVATSRDSTSVLYIVPPDGSRPEPTGGMTLGAGVVATAVVRALGEEVWIFEQVFGALPNDPFRPPAPNLYAQRFNVSTLEAGPEVLVARRVIPSAGPPLGAIEADGEGGFWVVQIRYDRDSEANAAYVEHMDAEGVGRWPTGGRGVIRLRDFSHVNLRPIDSDEAVLTLSGHNYGGRAKTRAFYLHGSDYLAWGAGAGLIPSTGGDRSAIRLSADRSTTLLWQHDAGEIYRQTASLDSLVNAFYLGEPTLPAGPVDRRLIGATESGPHLGVLFWGDNLDCCGDRFEVRALPDGWVPMVAAPAGLEIWTVDEITTVRWRSIGSGALDLDLSLDGGSTWMPLASGIPDSPDSLRFDVPDLPTESAHLRIRRIESNLAHTSDSFRIRPLGEGYGKSAGSLRLAFDEEGIQRAAALVALQPRDVYLLARADFADIGHGEWNGLIGMGGWEAGFDLQPEILVIETQLMGPGALDVSSDPLQWAVGFSGQLTLAPRWTPLMRVRLMSTAPLGREVRIDLDAATPSSFDNAGGPGRIPGWLERPASGECGNPCLRAFDMNRGESQLVLDPTGEGVPVFELHSSTAARVNQPFELPIRLSWSGPLGDTPWTQLNATLLLEQASTVVQGIRSESGNELRMRTSDEMLSFVYRRTDGGVLLGEQLFYLELIAGTQAESLRPILVDARVTDANGAPVTPLVEIASSDVTREVPTVVREFVIDVDAGVPTIRWSLASRPFALRIVANEEDSRRIVNSTQLSSPHGSVLDVDFDPLRTDYYTLDLLQTTDGPWVEVARVVAPSIAAGPMLSVQPNPVVDTASISFVLAGDQGGRVEIFDLRGRRVRSWQLASLRSASVLTWNAANDAGRKVAAGVYFVRLQSGERITQRKVLVVR